MQTFGLGGVERPTRPHIHVAPAANWVNDPNGPILWNGRYHLYYQHNPTAPRWGEMSWGHAVSDDLRTWSDEGIALAPTPSSPDADGCWSGCARIIDGRVTLFYTGLAIDGERLDQSVCRAVATDDTLRGFKKDATNPLIAASSRPAGHRQHRDPFLLRDDDGDRWLMLQSTGIDTPDYVGGAIVLYDSPDARVWTYQGVVCTLPDRTGDLDTGPVWECPAMFRSAEGTWVIVLAVQLPHGRPGNGRPYSLWLTGHFDGATFAIHDFGRLDAADVLYAPTLLEHPDGRQLLWGWVQETADQAVLDAIGSAGALSLPREIEVVQGRVRQRFARELDELWMDAAPSDVSLAPETAFGFDDPGPCWRLRLAAEGDIAIRVGQVGDEQLVLDVGADSVVLRQGAAVIAEIPVGRDAPLGLELIVDATIVELMTAGGDSLTARLPFSYEREVALVARSTAATARAVRLQPLRVTIASA